MDIKELNKYVTLDKAEVYVSTEKKDKWDHGGLPGHWLRLADYDSHAEFIAACKELHKDERSPELKFPFGRGACSCVLVDEGEVNPATFKLCAMCADMDERLREPFSRWCEGVSALDLDGAPEDVKERFLSSYVGEYASKEDFASDMLEMCEPALLDFALAYFNYSKYANDLLATDYRKDGTYYFKYEIY